MSDINSWLAELGLDKYISAFTAAEINYETLPDLLEEDLIELGLPLDPRRRAWGAIQRLGKDNDSPSGEVTTSAASAILPTTETQSDAERRHLTVMFVDLVGSTEMATSVARP